MKLEERMRRLLKEGQLDLPLPGSGETPLRHRMLAAFAREDVSLARLVEAHADAVSILKEAGQEPVKDALYGVWASEVPSEPLRLENYRVSGLKRFCSGASIVDRALVTVRIPDQLLIDIDLRENPGHVSFSGSDWIATAFAETNTSTTTFDRISICESQIVGPAHWYLSRPGFWNGACGPAACWVGAAHGLVDHARAHATDNPHNLAHLGAMQANIWAMYSALDSAGREMDLDPNNRSASIVRALSLRHVVENLCSDVLDRFGRACGPRPLAFDRAISIRHQELNLYLRQSHAERDLEVLGRQLSKPLTLVSRVNPFADVGT